SPAARVTRPSTGLTVRRAFQPAAGIDCFHLPVAQPGPVLPPAPSPEPPIGFPGWRTAVASARCPAPAAQSGLSAPRVRSADVQLPVHATPAPARYLSVACPGCPVPRARQTR